MQIFITYAHVDRFLVKSQIVEVLRHANHVVWFDERLIAAQDWKQQLQIAIADSDALLYAMTPESVASDWCQWELSKAVELDKPIIPVLLQSRTPIPIALSNIQYVDFSQGATADAVARLMGGLQKLSPDQIPAISEKLKGKPAQAYAARSQGEEILTTKNSIVNRETITLALTLIGTIAAVLALFPIFFNNNLASPTEQATPNTPIAVALRDIDILSGPDAGFDRLDILATNNSLDILGVSEDRRWYQVLLRDGSTGWILAAESGIYLRGNRGVIQVIVPTSTATSTASSTPTATPTAVSTLIPSDTPTNTETPDPTNTATQGLAIASSTFAAAATMTVFVPSVTPLAQPNTPIVSRSYPCDGQIAFGTGGLLNQVHIQPSANSPLRPPVQRGSNVRILGRVTDLGTSWYQIEYDDNSGWLDEQYLILSGTCP